MQERNERFFVVGLAVGVLGLLLFFALSSMLGQTSGFYGLPPRANGLLN